ncbi:MAG: response regulator [Myxococcales bacterium]|nr:response regulator [Myxococcales bacterium]
MSIILLVDQSQTIRRVVEMAFKASGHDIVAATSAAEGRQAIGRYNPAAVLISYRLPDERGVDVVRSLKSNPQTASIPVLLLGGTYAPFDENEARQSGADAILVKPFKTDPLLTTVAELLSGARRAAPPQQSAPQHQPVQHQPAQHQPVQHQPVQHQAPPVGPPPLGVPQTPPQPQYGQAPAQHAQPHHQGAMQPQPQFNPVSSSPASMAGFANQSGERRQEATRRFNYEDHVAPPQPTPQPQTPPQPQVPRGFESAAPQAAATPSPVGPPPPSPPSQTVGAGAATLDTAALKDVVKEVLPAIMKDALQQVLRDGLEERLRHFLFSRIEAQLKDEIQRIVQQELNRYRQ